MPKSFTACTISFDHSRCWSLAPPKRAPNCRNLYAPESQYNSTIAHSHNFLQQPIISFIYMRLYRFDLGNNTYKSSGTRTSFYDLNCGKLNLFRSSWYSPEWNFWLRTKDHIISNHSNSVKFQYLWRPFIILRVSHSFEIF